jgi:hypothetical protein
MGLDGSNLRVWLTILIRRSRGSDAPHLTSDGSFRNRPEPGAPCSTPGDGCTQEFVYDGGDRLVEEYDGHDRRIRYTLTPAGGIEEKHDADDTEAVFFRAEFDGTRKARRTLDPTITRTSPKPPNTRCFTTRTAISTASPGRAPTPSAIAAAAAASRRRCWCRTSPTTTATGSRRGSAPRTS